jgi:hypothetical protein
VSVATPPACPVSDRSDHFAPLAVAGTVHGRQVEVLVASLADVLAHIAAWTEQDPDAVGCWGLRADYSDSLTILLRHKAGTVREGRRTVHLVRLMPGVPHGVALTALCGERLTLLGAEALPVGCGMPCDGCLAESLVDSLRRVGPLSDRVVSPRVDLPAVH